MDTFFNFIEQLIKTLSQIGWVFTLVAGYLFARWQFKFESIHKRRLEVIEEAYAKLKLANVSFQSLTNPVQQAGELIETEKEKDFVQKANDMFVYLNIKKLFFDSNEQKHIDAISKNFMKAWNNYRYKQDIKNDPSERKEFMRLYKEVWDSADKEIPEIILSLEKTFKKALGLK